MVVLKQTLQLILSLGARMAEQGEYSKRAFLNGRLDLAQAESIMDIVQAKTERGVDLALSQLQGTVSGMVKKLQSLLQHDHTAMTLYFYDIFTSKTSRPKHQQK